MACDHGWLATTFSLSIQLNFLYLSFELLGLNGQLFHWVALIKRFANYLKTHNDTIVASIYNALDNHSWKKPVI